MSAKTQKQIKPVGKLINLPDKLWIYLTVDAERCKRSVTKQIEAILESYFELENVEINKAAVEFAQNTNNYQSIELTPEEIAQTYFPKKAEVIKMKPQTMVQAEIGGKVNETEREIKKRKVG